MVYVSIYWYAVSSELGTATIRLIKSQINTKLLSRERERE